jgi:hypothetical protein
MRKHKRKETMAGESSGAFLCLAHKDASVKGSGLSTSPVKQPDSHPPPVSFLRPL